MRQRWVKQAGGVLVLIGLMDSGGATQQKAINVVPRALWWLAADDTTLSTEEWISLLSTTRMLACLMEVRSRCTVLSRVCRMRKRAGFGVCMNMERNKCGSLH